MKEFWGGCASGIVQSIIGHPFDTIKVLMQTNKPLYKNPFHYYKGVTFPTAFNIMCTGLSFDIQSRLHKLTDSHYIAGAGTGTMIAPIIYLFDIGKIHKQTNPHAPLSLSHFKTTRGLGATFMREGIATSIYMGLYFSMEERNGPLISGGYAGLACWAITYPLDVIKTRQMSNVKREVTFHSAYKMGQLWKGFSACAMRAILVNAAGFWTYRKTIDSFSS